MLSGGRAAIPEAEGAVDAELFIKELERRDVKVQHQEL